MANAWRRASGFTTPQAAVFYSSAGIVLLRPQRRPHRLHHSLQRNHLRRRRSPALQLHFPLLQPPVPHVHPHRKPDQVSIPFEAFSLPPSPLGLGSPSTALRMSATAVFFGSASLSPHSRNQLKCLT